MNVQTTTFECKYNQNHGKITVSARHVEWEELNLMQQASAFFQPKKWKVNYDTVKDLKVHKSVPKLRIELSTPIPVPSTTLASTNTTSQSIDCEFTTVEARNQCKELIQTFIVRFKKESKLSPEERKKLRLLSKDVKLKQLYDELVGRGVLTQKEFWDARKHLLQDEGAIRSVDNLGPKNALDTILDPTQPQWTLNAQIIRQIFIEYPGVEKAYREKVPTEMTEEQFWKKFKDSYYFHKMKPQSSSDTSKREYDRQATEMFKTYERADENEAEQDLRVTRVEKFVDITRNENFGEGYGMKPDELTAPTKLSDNKLLKHFNLTSARVMKSYLGQATKSHADQPNVSDAIEAEKNGKSSDVDDEELRKHTIMDDLMVDDATQSFIPLKIQDKHRYFEGLLSEPTSKQPGSTATNISVNLVCTPMEMMNAFSEEVHTLQSPESGDLSHALISSDLASTIAGEIINLVSQNDVTLAEYQEQSLSPEFQRQFKSIFLLVNEMLRHMWGLLGIAVKQWNKMHDDKAKKLWSILQEHRKTLLSFQVNHQTKQLTNALIESIDVAYDLYNRKFGQQRPAAATPTMNNNNNINNNGIAQRLDGRPTMQPTTIRAPVSSGGAGASSTNRPTISFSLAKPGIGPMTLKKPTTPATHSSNMMQDDDEEDEEEDDVFNRPNKRIKS